MNQNLQKFIFAAVIMHLIWEPVSYPTKDLALCIVNVNSVSDTNHTFIAIP